MKALFGKVILLGLIAVGPWLMGDDQLHPKALKVVTTINELAWLAEEIGGEYVKAEALLQGTENPHYIDALPSFIQKVAEADAVLIVGLDLEVGWMPKVLSRSANAKVQPGGQGYCEVGRTVKVLEKPKGSVDRSMGDVHPGGNPHFWLSPTGLIEASQAVVDTLGGLRPKQVATFLANQKAFTLRMNKLLAENKEKIRAVTASQPWLMEYHKEFSYLLRDYDLRSFGSVEEKPGVPPSAGRLAQVSIAANASGVRVLLTAQYAPKNVIERFSEMSKIPAVVVPTSFQKSGKFQDFESLHRHIIQALVEVANQSKKGVS